MVSVDVKHHVYLHVSVGHLASTDRAGQGTVRPAPPRIGYAALNTQRNVPQKKKPLSWSNKDDVLINNHQTTESIFEKSNNNFFEYCQTL